jgi:hypothetical protein
MNDAATDSSSSVISINTSLGLSFWLFVAAMVLDQLALMCTTLALRGTPVEGGGSVVGHIIDHQAPLVYAQPASDAYQPPIQVAYVMPVAQQQQQQGYPQQGYPQADPPQGYPQQGYPPQGYPQQGYAPPVAAVQQAPPAHNPYGQPR